MKKIVLLGVAVALTGCSLAPVEPESVLTPQRVTKYETVDELIAKSPNINSFHAIRSYYAETKNLPLNEIKIPAATLNMYCTQKEGGVFTKVKSGEPFYWSSDRRIFVDENGTYTCVKNGKTLWATDVKLNRTDSSPAGSLVHALLDVKKIDGAAYDKMVADELKAKRDQEARTAASHKIIRDSIKKEEDAYLAEKAKRKPVTAKNIGDTICREVRVFNGDYHGFKNLYNYNNIIAGSLEEFPANGTNLKVSLLGGIDNQNKIHPGPTAKFNGIYVEPGKVIWEKKTDWYKCDY